MEVHGTTPTKEIYYAPSCDPLRYAGLRRRPYSDPPWLTAGKEMLGAQYLTGSLSMSRTEHTHKADDAYEYIQTSNVANYIRTKDPKLFALATYPPQHTDSLVSGR